MLVSGTNLHPPAYEGRNYKLWCGDSAKILKTFPDNCVHLIVTSPPYYIRSGLYTDLDDDIENAPTYDEYISKLLEILRECHRVLVPGGRMCVNIADSWTNLAREKVNMCYPTHAHIIVEMINTGMEYKGSIIYKQIRVHHASGGALKLLGSFPYPPNLPLLNLFEYILIFKKKGEYTKKHVPPHIREASKITKEELVWLATGVWQIPPNRQRKPCPAPFPIEIPRRLIKLFSFVGDIVLDPFMGQGTCVEVAVQLGRVGWGIDINPEYVAYTAERVSSILPLY